MNQLNEPNADMASEPAAIYYGTSQQLRELKHLGKEDTVWIIRFMQRHLDELTFAEKPLVSDPLAVLDQLGTWVKATGKTSEELINEHLDEKLAV
jgi:hypothetical protein